MIIHFFLKNNPDENSTMKQLKDEGSNKRTIQRVLKRYVATAKVSYSKKSDSQPSARPSTNIWTMDVTVRKFKNYGMKITKEVAEKSDVSLFAYFKSNLDKLIKTCSFILI